MAAVGDDIRRLTDQLRHKDPDERLEAAARLGCFGQLAAAAVPDLAAALGDRYAEVRRAAASALSEMGPDARAAVAALSRALSDPDEGVRRRSALALGEIGQEARAAVAGLARMMAEDASPAARRHAAAALGEIGPGAVAAIGPLIEALATEDVRLRAIAGASLLRLRPRSVPRLIEALGHSSPRVREGAARLLYKSGTPPSADEGLRALLEDADEGVREAAREALGV